MESTSGLKIQEAYQCLKYVRVAPGKVYEYELYQILQRPEFIHENVNIAKMINELFGMEFAVCDKVESSYAGEGLNVIYTNPEYRLVLDILLSTQKDYPFDRTVYIDCTEENVEGDKAEILLFYHEVEKKLHALLKKHPNHYYILQAMQIMKEWPKKIELDVVDADEIWKYRVDNVLDLSGKYIRNLDCRKLSCKTEEGAIIRNLRSEQAFFCGDKILFDEVIFKGGASFKGSIFKAVTLSFRNAKFYLDDDVEIAQNTIKMNEITFRNTKMFVRDLIFDGVVVDGEIENKILSFEDAVIEAKYISFSKMKLNNAILFCYQAIMKDASLRFVEPQFENSTLDFEDSIVKDIIMLNISGLPKTAFNFRRCQKLIVENCNIVDNVILSGMDTLSLRACRNQGKILTDWAKKEKDAEGNKNYPILLAIMHNTDDNITKAEQFILLKENFANLGQYDYEDEAFIQYMNHKCKNSPIRGIYGILKGIGQYGISPGRVLLTMMWTVIAFFFMYLFCAFFVSESFSYSITENGPWGCIANSFYLSVSNLVSYNSSIYPCSFVTILLSIVESIIGWFLLGYLSIAVVRKTLR